MTGSGGVAHGAAAPRSVVDDATGLAWGGHRLVLLPQRAAWLPDLAMLLVADVHLGKAQTFRRLGTPVPHGTTADTLDRLGDLLRSLRPRRLVVLGDLLHSAHAQAARIQDALHRWRDLHHEVEMTLVRGNHDDRAGDPPASTGIVVVDEPWPVVAAVRVGVGEGVGVGVGRDADDPAEASAGGGLWLAHHPRAVPGAAVLAGHEHPCTGVGGRARDHLRLPCFHFRDGVGVLPAFGAFTGMHPVRRRPGDRVYAVAERVVAIP